MTIQVCPQCGAQFLRVGRKKYCSKLCYRRGHVEDARERARLWRINNPDKYQARLERIRVLPKFSQCLECGETFHKHTTGKFCSISCRGKHRRKTQPEWYQRKHEEHRVRNNERNLRDYRRSKAISPWRYMVHAARSRASAKALTFNLTNEWAESRWTGKCELTGIPFVITSGRTPYSPSLDRIDQKEGYLVGNCRFILWGLNALRGPASDATMYAIAEALLRARDANTAHPQVCEPPEVETLSTKPSVHIG